MKRLIRLAAAVVAGVVLCAPPSATAKSSYDDGTYTWLWEWTDDETGAVLYGNNVSTVGITTNVVTVPPTVKATLTGWDEETETEYEYEAEIPVTGLGGYLFEDCEGITKVVLPDSIREIGVGAFSGCTSLEEINVPADLVACDSGAFEDTAWQDAQTGDFLVFGPVLLEYRGTNTVVEIPDGVGVIPEDVFSENEDIVSVSIPASVREIGDWAFAGCENLLTVTGADSVEVCGCEAFDGTAFWEAAASNAPVCVGSAVVGYKGTLPETLEIAEGVACIADEAFAECADFTTVSLPASLRRIGNRSFADCFVWAAMPGDGDDDGTVSTATAGYAYDGSAADSTGSDSGSDTGSDSGSGEGEGTTWIAKGLTRVVIPQTLESIGEDAFVGCLALTDVTVEGGEAFETVPLCDVFDGCPVANLSINRTWVGEDCWFDTLETLVLGDDVCEIGEDAFSYCESLASVTFGEGLEYIGAYAFEGCSALTGITLPAGVVSIDESAFAGCDALTSVTFGEGLEYIGAYAFEGCSTLTSLTIPASVEEIAEGAFADCDALEEVVFEGDMDEIDMDAFDAFAGTPWLDEAFPVPENDDFANAELLEGESGSAEGTLRYATVEMGDCALDFTDPLATVWYKWKAPFTGTVLFTADAADEEDSWLFRLIATRGRANGNIGGDDGEYGSAVAGFADDGFDIWGGATSGSDTSGSDYSSSDSSGYDSGEEEWGDCWFSDADWVVFDVVEGETYYLSVAIIDDDEDAVGSGDFTLSWEQVYRPENDNFADAIALTGESGSVTGANILATVEEDDPLAVSFGSEATVWWKWTAETNDWITFDTTDSDFDTVIDVSCIDGNSGYGWCSAGWVTFEAVAGTTYYIAVGGYDDEAGEIVLNWYRYQLVVEDGILSGYRGTLPEELDIPEGVTAIADYVFANVASLKAVNLSASLQSIGEQAFAGCEALESVTIPASVEEIGYGAFEDCASLKTVEFEGERDAIDMNPMDAFAGTPWQQDTYLAEFETPGNDNFADAFELTGVSGSVLGTNILATAEAGDPLAGAYDSEATVWWKWTAETNDWVTFDVIDSNFDTVIGVYTGESLETLETVEKSRYYVTFEAVAGMTYYIAVGGRGDASGKSHWNGAGTNW